MASAAANFSCVTATSATINSSRGESGDAVWSAVSVDSAIALVAPCHPVPGARVVGLKSGQRAVLSGGVAELREGEVRACQQIARIRVVGHRGHRLAEWRQGVLHAPSVEQRSAQEKRGRRKGRIERQCLLERGDGLGVLPGHVARHAKVQEQAGILRPMS